MKKEALISIEKLPVHVANLGTCVLSYILDLSEDEIQNLINNGGQVTTQRKLVIDNLSRIAPQIVNRRTRSTSLDDSDIFQWRKFIAEGTSKHLFNALREMITTETENTNTYDDPILQSFYNLAIEAYPALLLPKEKNNYFKNFLIPSFRGTPLLANFIELIRKDEVISKIFPDKAECSPFIRTSRDTGGYIHLYTFFDMLFNDSYKMMRLYNKLSLNDLMEYTEQLLYIIRKAIKGEEAFVPLVVGFKGAYIETENEFEFYNGTITNPHKGIEDLTRNSDNKGIEDLTRNSDNKGFIYITKVPYKINLDTREQKDIMSSNERNYPKVDTSTIDRIIESIPLAFSLSSSDDKLISVGKIFEFYINPLSLGDHYSYKLDSVKQFDAQCILESEISGIKDLCHSISSSDDKNISLAKKRLQTALLEREKHEDSFIDAIIGLENLFGDREQIALSVSSCVARLLESDKDGRDRVFTDLKKLYGFRSKIVHGSTKGSGIANIKENTNKAILYLIKSMKELYTKDEGKLLSINQADRVKEIILSLN